MIGILIVAHAPLATALLQCARHVHGGDPEHCEALDIAANAEPVAQLDAARAMVAGLDAGEGVLVLTDLFGATPANIAAQLAHAGKVEVVTGISLPMLLRVLTYRAAVPLAALVEKAISGGTAGVMKIASTAQQNQRASGTGPDHPDSATALENEHARLQDQQ